MTPIFLGIDPGFDRLGWAIGTPDKQTVRVMELGTIVTKRSQTVFQRYVQIIQEIQAVLAQFEPTELAIETLYFANNKTTAMRVSETRGIVLGQCLANGIEIFEYNPTQIKQVAAGSGKADKPMMQKMVRMQTTLPNRATLDDAIDAVAALITHNLLRKQAL